MDRNSKTIARLERRDPFSPIIAMSGWSHGQWDLIRVSGREWTDEVYRIVAMVDHQLALHDCDQGAPGKFYACHAEKQLIACFIDRHVFLLQDSSTVVALEELVSSIWDLKQTLKELRLFSAGGRNISEVKKKNRKEELESELYDEYDRRHTEESDGDKVKHLRARVENVETELR